MRSTEECYSCAGSSNSKHGGPSEPTPIAETLESINRHLRAAKSDIDKLQEQLQPSRRKLEELYPEIKETQAAARAEHGALKDTMASLSEEVRNYRSFHEKLKEEKKHSDKLNFKNKLLRIKIGALKDKEEAMRELKSKRAAMAEDRKHLQQQFNHLLEKAPIDLKEQYITVLKETERLDKDNSLMTEQVIVLRAWYEQNAALCEDYENMKTLKQLLTQENDRLGQEIQQIDQNISNQNTFLKMIDALKVLYETVSCQNTGLQREMERLDEYQNAKQFRDSYNESFSRTEDLKKENDHLRKQIQVVSEQLQSTGVLKVKYTGLEAEEKSAMVQNRVLAKTYSEKLEKLAKEEDWTHKCDKMKEQIDALNQGNGKILDDIQRCNENLQYLNDLKSQHRLMKTEKKKFVDQQNTLHRNLRELEKRFSKQHDQTEKNKVLLLEINNLNTDNCALWDRIETLKKSLQDENILSITFNSLMGEKNAMKQQNKALHKEVQKLIKQLDKEKCLEERCVAVKVEKEEISRQNCVLETDIQNSFRR